MEKFSLLQIFGETLLRLGAKYKNLVVFDTDLSSASKTHLFAKNFSDRHFHFGLAEQNLVAASSGFAIRGKLPFVCSDALFLTGRAYTQIRNMVCYPNMNVKFVGVNAGLASGKDGAVMHSLEDVALMRCIPNMKIFSPADCEELRCVMHEMIDGFGPMYLRLSAGELPNLYDDGKGIFKSGKADIVRKGKDICVFATGSMVFNAICAAEKLKDDLSVMVVNVSTIRPLDEKLILDVASRVKFVVSAEDHFVNGGLGSALADLFSEKYPVRLHKIAISGFSESGSKEDLYDKYGLNADCIVNKLRKIAIGI